MNAAREELYELLATRATEGLSQADSDHLDALLASHPDVEPWGFEQAAAALHLALLGPERPVPDRLKLRLVAAGERCLAESGVRIPETETATPRSGGSLGWWAAAAAVALALAGWWPRLQDGPADAPRAAATAAPTPESLLEDAATVRWPWSATEDTSAAGAAGEVVWNSALQTGFMRFSGLAPNDPAVSQYQLWIFDRARDERYPVDGGVFDMAVEGGEVVIPIDAKIRVEEPYLFAVTVEQPGGVVVSDRQRIALLAQA